MLVSRLDSPTVSVLIPTKNRPVCLERVVQLLLSQTVLPDQIVIVDQSVADESRRRVEALLAEGSSRRTSVRVDYMHDRAIPGAAVARNRAMSAAEGIVWLFLDDDMEPEADFIEQLLTVYRESPAVGGVSGIITNYARPSLAFRVWSGLFLRGPFFDERQAIYWRAEQLRHHAPIPVSKFGSGLMSFRADLVRDVRFDESLQGLPPGEDIDFCARLGPDARLVIAPGARIAHQASASGRSEEYWVKEYAQGKLYVYHRNWAQGVRNRLCCLWFEIGCSVVAVFASLRRRSLTPWRAFAKGVREAEHLARGVESGPVPR